MPTSLRYRWLFISLCFLCLPTARLAADVAHLVADLNPLAGPNVGSEPGELAALGGLAVFSALEAQGGRRLWATDGTATGTVLLHSSLEDPLFVRELDGRLIYGARGPDGRGLWATNGTAQETRRLTPEGVAPFVEDLASARSRLWFFERHATGSTLWASDGTPAGTRALLSLGARETLGATAVGDRLFFFASEGLSTPDCGPIHCEDNDLLVWKLWVSDGTARGTRPLRRVGVFLGKNVPVSARVATEGTFFFFLVSNVDSPIALWASRGTGATTGELARFPPSSLPFGGNVAQRAGERLAFFARAGAGGPTQLWVSDGTVHGTHPATAFEGDEAFNEGGALPTVAVHGSELYVAAKRPELGSELWATDGSPASTRLVADLCPGTCSGLSIFTSYLPLRGELFFVARNEAGNSQLWRTTPAGGSAPLFEPGTEPYQSAGEFPAAAGQRLLFTAADASGTSNLWQTDGTTEGTAQVSYFGTNGVTGPISAFSAVRLGRAVVFPFRDEIHGSELWLADGSPAGTRLVTDLVVGNGPSSEPFALTPLGDQTIFFACTADRPALWSSRGDRASTTLLTTVAEDCQSFYGSLFREAPPLPTAAGRAFFFKDKNLWASDGTVAGTRALTTFDPADFTVSVGAVTAFGSGVLFVVYHYDIAAALSRVALWQSDGTAEGTALLANLPELNGIFRLTTLGDQLFFVGYERNPPGLETDTFEIWTSDGTAEGTRKLSNRRSPLYFSDPASHFFTPFDGRTYFVLDDQLWRTDGTPAGTEVLTSLFESASSCGRDPWALRAWNGALYFIAEVGCEGEMGLWRSDGTPAGTLLLHRLGRTGFTGLTRLEELGGRLYFLASADPSGRRLWATDGTAAGTVPVGPPLTELPYPPELIRAGERLFFQGGDGAHGLELWASDGTDAGTRLLHDVAPGIPSSQLGRLTAVGSRLDFVANDGLVGTELWSLPLASACTCQPASDALCLENGHYRLEAIFRTREGRTGRAQAGPLTPESGSFWFFNPDHADLLVKVLENGSGTADDRLFVGALTNADFDLTVTNLATGGTERYRNLLGQFPSFAAAPPKAGVAGPCVENAERLCLVGGRFAVELSFSHPEQGPAGATARPFRDGSGFFWFFRPANLEAAVKIIDGRAVNGHFWVFVAGLTDLETILTITDTATGTSKTYRKPQGAFSSFADTAAF